MPLGEPCAAFARILSSMARALAFGLASLLMIGSARAEDAGPGALAGPTTMAPSPPPAYDESPPSAPRSSHRVSDPGGWPRHFVASLSFLSGTVDFRDAFFETRDMLSTMEGASLLERRMRTAGGELSLRLAPTRFVEVGLGLGFSNPAVGAPRPVTTARRETVYVREAHVAFWHGELDLVARWGPVALSLGVRAGWTRMLLELGGDGPATMRAARATVGPHADLRLHLYRSLFAHAGGWLDLASWPDAKLVAGLGLARR